MGLMKYRFRFVREKILLVVNGLYQLVLNGLIQELLPPVHGVLSDLSIKLCYCMHEAGYTEQAMVRRWAK